MVLAGFLGTLRYEVTEADPVTFVAVPLVSVLVAVASAWIPARRAVGLDPREALADE